MVTTLLRLKAKEICNHVACIRKMLNIPHLCSIIKKYYKYDLLDIYIKVFFNRNINKTRVHTK